MSNPYADAAISATSNTPVPPLARPFGGGAKAGPTAQINTSKRKSTLTDYALLMTQSFQGRA